MWIWYYLVGSITLARVKYDYKDSATIHVYIILQAVSNYVKVIARAFAANAWILSLYFYGDIRTYFDNCFCP